MNPFATRLSPANSWVLPVCAMALILGVMLNFAWITAKTRRDRLQYLGSAQGDRIRVASVDVLDEYRKVTEEVTKLREENTKLQNAMGSTTSQFAVLNKSLQDAKMLAGLTAVEGPGVKIVLTDGKAANVGFGTDAIIHDTDVLKVVNELWASGAEAVSVNEHRVSGRSSFRCVGPVIHIDNVPTATPVTIKAIGDPDALFGGLNLPGGILDEIRQTDASMVKVEKMKSVLVPAFSGSTTMKFAEAVKPDRTGSDGGGSGR